MSAAAVDIVWRRIKPGIYHSACGRFRVYRVYGERIGMEWWVQDLSKNLAESHVASRNRLREAKSFVEAI